MFRCSDVSRTQWTEGREGGREGGMEGGREGGREQKSQHSYALSKSLIV